MLRLRQSGGGGGGGPVVSRNTQLFGLVGLICLGCVLFFVDFETDPVLLATTMDGAQATDVEVPHRQGTKERHRCPPPSLSLRVAIVGNEFLQQLPLVAEGGIEASVENLAWGVVDYMTKNPQEVEGEWCVDGWVQIKELIAVVPKRAQTTDLNGNPYPFRVYDTPGGPGTPTHEYAAQARRVLEALPAEERPDVIWSQSGWSVDGLKHLGIPIICTIQDSGDRQYTVGAGVDPRLVHYRFISQNQRNIWARTDRERAISSSLFTGLTESEYSLGDPNKRAYYLHVSSRWGRLKGIDEVMRLAILNPSDEFRVYGSADLESELVEFARQHTNFIYSSRLVRGEPHRLAFQQAKGLIMFTHLEEALGRVSLEAIAKGTPVFGSARGANRELITPEMGFVTNDIEELSRHLHDQFNYTRIYELARQRHHISKEVQGLLAISKSLIAP